MRKSLMTAALAAAFALAATPSYAGWFDHDKKGPTQIPVCGHNIGTLAIREPGRDWWTPMNLPTPEVLLKVFVRKSGCFTLVDRGKGFEMAQEERQLAASGTLRRGSNIGRGQVKAADYILVPDIASKNGDSGGVNIGAILGGLFPIPGVGGILVSQLSLKSSDADVVLSIVNVRTSEDGPIEQGHASKTDIGFGGGGLGIGGSGFAGAAASSYEHTDIGQVLILAYIDAYTQLVKDLGGQPVTPEPSPSADDAKTAQASDTSAQAVASPAPASTDSGALPANASAAAPPAAYMMVRAGHLFASPSTKSKKLRALRVGDRLYFTGGKSGDWLEVKEEMGTQGWVRADFVAYAQ